MYFQGRIDSVITHWLHYNINRNFLHHWNLLEPGKKLLYVRILLIVQYNFTAKSGDLSVMEVKSGDT